MNRLSGCGGPNLEIKSVQTGSTAGKKALLVCIKVSVSCVCKSSHWGLDTLSCAMLKAALGNTGNSNQRKKEHFVVLKLSIKPIKFSTFNIVT